MALHVLVIDDDTVDREAIRRHLCRPGKDIEVHQAETGDRGLQRLETERFDCVFLDYHLADVDGISLLRRVYRKETDLAPSPVVMLTGQGNEAVMADALRWGAQDYLVKSNINADTLAIAMAKAREIFELKKSRNQAEEHLRHAQKMEAVGRLTSGIAHDFNNLLTVMLGNARLIQKRLQDETVPLSREDIARKMQAIDASAKKGAELIRRLMVFTRQRPMTQEIVDVNETVRETYELLQRSLGELVEVKSVLKNENLCAKVDPGQFQNALINIAINARDAMPKGGKLTIETDHVVLDEEYTFANPEIAPGPYVVIAISDTGSGMPAHVKNRIFEPFYTTKAAGEGTGLGLSMVYGLVQQSGGYIHVYSEEGHGSVFRIYLPRSGAPANEDAARGEMLTGTETILVVEDDDEVRTVARNMLERLGYQLILAPDGRTALEILKRHHRDIDLIFTDILMPGGMNGAELVRQAQDYYPGVRVLYTSGYTENAIPDYQLIEGEELIGKPYRKDVLARKIRDVLGREPRSQKKVQENERKAARSGD